jgi:hypothetical protein
LVCGLALGCSSTEPAAAEAPEGSEPTTGAEVVPGSEAATPAETPADVTATQPDAQKLKAHADAHITYPATRAQILEACAKTPEFTEGEKKWIADTLPEGTYNSADDVLKALQPK